MALPLKPKRLIQNGLVAHYAPIRQRNLLKWSEDFSNAVWSKLNCTVTNNNEIAPDGTLTADKIEKTSTDAYITQQMALNGDNIFSIWLKGIVGETTALYIRLAASPYSVYGLKQITFTDSEWHRYYVSANIPNVVCNMRVLLQGATGNATVVYAWGAQLELSPSATTYQRTTDLQTLWNQKQENMSVTNIVQGGNFPSTSGWSSVNATLSINNNILSVIGDGVSRYPTLKRFDTNSLIAGRKYYVKTKCKVTNSSCLSINLWLYDGVSLYVVSNPINGNIYTLSGVGVASITTTNLLTIEHKYVDATTANGKVMEVQQVLAIDLTSLFGAGNEPTAQQCDEMFKYWFDGSIRMNLPGMFSNKQYTATNIIQNGNFVDTSIWTPAGSTLTVSANKGIITGSGTTRYPQIYQSISSSINSKIYVRAKIKSTSASPPQAITIACAGTATVFQANPVQDVVYTLSGIRTMLSVSESLSIFGTYVDTATALGKVIEVQEVLVIDLSLLFGLGNEPTITQCDVIFSNYFVGNSTIYIKSSSVAGILGNSSSSDGSDPIFTGEGFKFDGIDDYIELGNNEYFQLQNGFYIEFIFKASIANGYIIAKNLSTVTDMQYGIYWNYTNKSVVGVINGVARGASANNSIPENTYVHVGFMYDRNNVYYFVNGILSGVPTVFTDAILPTSSTVNIGRRKSSAYLNGEIAYLNMCNRALTDTERIKNYNYLKQIIAGKGIMI